jgi:NAD(P)H-dependent flavin oxidoreductase YrpB (nitropropane dioxygenase family)
VTRSIDGAPQRVVNTPLVERLERATPPRRVLTAALNGLRFKRLTGTSFASLLREGWQMKRSQELSSAQALMAPNALMLTKAALIDGRPESGVLPVGQVVGLNDDLPRVADLIERILREAIATLDRLGKLGSPVASAKG